MTSEASVFGALLRSLDARQNGGKGDAHDRDLEAVSRTVEGRREPVQDFGKRSRLAGVEPEAAVASRQDGEDEQEREWTERKIGSHVSTSQVAKGFPRADAQGSAKATMEGCSESNALSLSESRAKTENRRRRHESRR